MNAVLHVYVNLLQADEVVSTYIQPSSWGRGGATLMHSELFMLYT